MPAATINNNPHTVTASPDTMICNGDVADISATVTGNAPFTYSWSPSGGNTSSITANPSVTTTFTVTVTDDNSCTSSDTVVITVEQVPVANFTAVVTAGNNVELTNTSTSNLPFTSSWDFGDGSPLENTEDATHTYADAGVYTVQLTVTSDCGTDIFTEEVTISDANNVNELSTLTNINVYPNPSQGGVFELVIENVTTNKIRINVLDFTGRAVFHIEEEAQGEFRKTLDLSSFSKGIYSMKLESDNGTEIRKLIIQ